MLAGYHLPFDLLKYCTRDKAEKKMQRHEFTKKLKESLKEPLQEFEKRMIEELLDKYENEVYEPKTIGDGRTFFIGGCESTQGNIGNEYACPSRPSWKIIR